MPTDNHTTSETETDLLSAIYNIEIHNEEKISGSDRTYCEEQQENLYKSLDEINRWYGIFVAEANKYKNSHRISYTANGKIRNSDPCSDRYDYTKMNFMKFEFKPFDNINSLVKNYGKAISAFSRTVIAYFNRTYNVSVPYPKIDGENLPMGFRPVYQSYVDMVIEHLGGRSFRNTTEDELINRFHRTVKPGSCSKVKPELKKDKIVFPDVIRFDEFWNDKNKMHYNYRQELENFCAGIAFGADNTLSGSSSMIIRFNDDNINISEPYDLTSSNAEEIKFFKNGRIDIKFKDARTAESCYHKLKLDTIVLKNNEY